MKLHPAELQQAVPGTMGTGAKGQGLQSVLIRRRHNAETFETQLWNSNKVSLGTKSNLTVHREFTYTHCVHSVKVVQNTWERRQSLQIPL